jgi:hypothetical protein
MILQWKCQSEKKRGKNSAHKILTPVKKQKQKTLASISFSRSPKEQKTST